MKHSVDGQDFSKREELAAEAARLLGELDVAVDQTDLRTCCAYLLLVLDLSRHVNLTAIRDPMVAMRLHVVDSLAALPAIPGAPPGRLCDLGSGGGFPGVPLCVAGHRRGMIVDSVGRKVVAVSQALEALSLQALVVARSARAEVLASSEPASFAVVTARALAELPIIIEYAAPLLVENGVFLAFKGTPTEEEILRGDRVAEICGLKRTDRLRRTLPGGGEHRQIIVYRREGPPRVALPRGVGMAARHPLA